MDYLRAYETEQYGPGTSNSCTLWRMNMSTVGDDGEKNTTSGAPFCFGGHGHMVKDGVLGRQGLFWICPLMKMYNDVVSSRSSIFSKLIVQSKVNAAIGNVPGSDDDDDDDDEKYVVGSRQFADKEEYVDYLKNNMCLIACDPKVVPMLMLTLKSSVRDEVLGGKQGLMVPNSAKPCDCSGDLKFGLGTGKASARMILGFTKNPDSENFGSLYLQCLDALQKKNDIQNAVGSEKQAIKSSSSACGSWYIKFADIGPKGKTNDRLFQKNFLDEYKLKDKKGRDMNVELYNRCLALVGVLQQKRKGKGARGGTNFSKTWLYHEGSTGTSSVDDRSGSEGSKVIKKRKNKESKEKKKRAKHSKGATDDTSSEDEVEILDF